MACPTVLASIAQEKCPTAPGLKTTVKIAFKDDVVIGAATNHAVSTITPADTDLGFYEFEIERKDNNLESTPTDNGGFNTELKGFIKRQSSAKSNILTGMNGVEDFVVIARDQNNNQHLLGSDEHPCLIQVKASVSPKNGYEVTIKWDEHADLPLFFTGTAPLAA